MLVMPTCFAWWVDHQHQIALRKQVMDLLGFIADENERRGGTAGWHGWVALATDEPFPHGTGILSVLSARRLVHASTGRPALARREGCAGWERSHSNGFAASFRWARGDAFLHGPTSPGQSQLQPQVQPSSWQLGSCLAVRVGYAVA
jgi:hypothetical protein